jgi:hypothetical protein
MTTTRSVDNFETPGGFEVIGSTMFDLHKTITYFLRQETYPQDWHLEELAAAVYLLTVLAERSPLMLSLKVEEVRHWRDLYIPMYDHYWRLDEIEPELRANILDTFSRLEAVAALRPKQWWEDE